jgi:hypothetical protein
MRSVWLFRKEESKQTRRQREMVAVGGSAIHAFDRQGERPGNWNEKKIILTLLGKKR